MRRFLCLVFPLLANFPVSANSLDLESYEHRLLSALESLLTYQQQSAVTQLEHLTKDYPNSRSGYLLYADILAARGGLIPAINQPLGHLNRDVVSELRQQLRIRWHYWHTIHLTRNNRWPAALLHLGAKQRMALYMDIPAARLFVYQNREGRLEEVGNFYV